LSDNSTNHFLASVTNYLASKGYVNPGVLNYITLSVYYFYQIRDLSIAFGLDNMLPYYSKQKKGLKQLRKVSGKLKFEYLYQNSTYVDYFVLVRDVSGLEAGSLKDIALGCGLQVETKTSLDSYKKDISQAVKQIPDVFFKYAIMDCVYIYQIIWL
jgi:hypothetical protein